MNDLGFSVLEVMVALALAIIVASIAYPNYRAHVQGQQQKIAIMELHRLANYLAQYRLVHRSYLGADKEAITKNNVYYHYQLGCQKGYCRLTAQPKNDQLPTLILNRKLNIVVCRPGEAHASCVASF